MNLTPQQHAAVIAGLRLLAEHVENGTPDAEKLDVILTAGDAVEPLDAAAIDDLAYNLNTETDARHIDTVRFAKLEAITLATDTKGDY